MDNSASISRVIIGIGNPGVEYNNTRHNLGFDVVEELAKQLNSSFDHSMFFALGAQAFSSQKGVFLLKPLTYVNRSGICAKAVQDWYHLCPSDVLVIVDDIALPVGKIRFRRKGSSGGHNGLKSIIASLQTEEFPRLRIGIGCDSSMDLASFVLSAFNEQEKEIIEQATEQAVKTALEWL